jgi:hypothetical protein
MCGNPILKANKRENSVTYGRTLYAQNREIILAEQAITAREQGKSSG